MRKTTALVALLALGACGNRERVNPPGDHPPARIRARVDLRVETLSILCWLAGMDEYAQGYATPYRTALTPLERWRDHPAVVATRALRNDANIAYNAPVSLAVHLDDQLRFRGAWQATPAELDARWREVDLGEYLEKVRAFTRDAQLPALFASQRSYFDRVERAYQDFLDANPVVPWFERTLGPHDDTSYVLIPGLLTGPQNYGARAIIGEEKIMYQVVMLRELDRDGVPHPDLEALSLLVHELGHGYVNPVFDARQGEVAATAEPIYARVATAMGEQAYASALIMTNETVVRALTILYLRGSFPRTSRDQAAHDRRKSFLWIDEVVTVLDGRLKASGRLGDDDLVAAVNLVFNSWLAAHPH